MALSPTDDGADAQRVRSQFLTATSATGRLIRDLAKVRQEGR
jgi:hypothetical protein